MPREFSAGGVLVRRTGDALDVAVIQPRGKPNVRALPKGHLDPGERPEETAVRETREETGLQAEIEEPISSITYFFVRGRTRFHKTVHFFLMRPIGGRLEDHDHEFDEVRWIQIEEALELMTHATERAVVLRATELLAAQGENVALAVGGAIP
jgi:8-oxo-dGTP pyrophosphatase MutT (NUDIX family)